VTASHKQFGWSICGLELEYLAVYGRASMGVPVGELQYGR